MFSNFNLRCRFESGPQPVATSTASQPSVPSQPLGSLHQTLPKTFKPGLPDAPQTTTVSREQVCYFSYSINTKNIFFSFRCTFWPRCWDATRTNHYWLFQGRPLSTISLTTPSFHQPSTSATARLKRSEPDIAEHREIILDVQTVQASRYSQEASPRYDQSHTLESRNVSAMPLESCSSKQDLKENLTTPITNGDTFNVNKW